MYLLADLTLDAGVGLLQVCTLLSEVCNFDLLFGPITGQRDERLMYGKQCTDGFLDGCHDLSEHILDCRAAERTFRCHGGMRVVVEQTMVD